MGGFNLGWYLVHIWQRQVGGWGVEVGLSCVWEGVCYEGKIQRGSIVRIRARTGPTCRNVFLRKAERQGRKRKKKGIGYDHKLYIIHIGDQQATNKVGGESVMRR